MKLNYLHVLQWSFVVCCALSISAQNNPMSDPTNASGWVFCDLLSDEFNGTSLDKNKWWILGENGDYRSKWKGRAPGQFAPQNVKVENGNLILSSQWEPNFTFLNESQDGTPYGGVNKSHPITQAAIISERFFKYGYMEIRCKLAEAPVTGAFWTTGYHSEIDMVENYGKRPIGNPKNRPESLERKYRTNLINWDSESISVNDPIKVETDVNVRVASDYYVYGFEWDKDYVKIFFNGVEINRFTRAELEVKDQWKYMYPQELWLDTEVFEWYGLPAMADLNVPAEFKIDYVRIWQKEKNAQDFNALGFEGPFYYQGRSSNWYANNTHPWKMKNDKAATGDLSLRFKNTTPLPATFTYTMYSPYGVLNLPTGDNEIKMKIWIDPNTAVNNLRVILRNPFKIMDIDISGVQKGKWVEISKGFTRNVASDLSITNGDRLEIQLRNTDVVGSNALLYIDDISFQKVNLGLKTSEIEKTSFKVFPNPANESVTVVSSENGTVTIFNMLGVAVKKVTKNTQSQVISVADLNKGMYLISIHSNTKTLATQKLIIE
ncbi:T9SS type A sorting domain-containing protein [Flavobacterium fluviatile]|uniref:T9SS type A sorting domain-containing protein n=1 Tax=Flavobacterium fluviatile TaxID=1862387 RepID=UPI0013D06D2C|nr:T9SS type A sorting domain-containing protein [Flavobacterium fluviatile]